MAICSDLMKVRHRIVLIELSDSTSLNNVVELPPPAPFSTWTYQPEDLLPLCKYDACTVGFSNGRLTALMKIECCKMQISFEF